MMNRLEAMILRMTAQRAALDWAFTQIQDVPGDLVEIGLGNGRTYDHIREHMPGRRIWAIERKLQPHPSCMPPAQDLLEGDASEGLARLEGAGIALANYDLGGQDPQTPDERAVRLTPLIAAALAPAAAVLVSTQRLPEHPKLRQAETSDEIGQGRVFIYLSAS
ncbi:MAG: class I SAM-dependent methyltransferase [Neomegalonema sp.]|nr:class I SAM-dependent methyltransferase [Neomegalonema sp.]